MSDWIMSELENIAWDKFCNNDDHIVPHQVGEQVNEFVGPGDFHKKPRHEVENVAKSTDGSGSAIKSSLQRKEETYFHSLVKDGNSTLPKGSRSYPSDNVIPASCDTDGNIFCSQVPILESKACIDGSRSCHLSLDDVTPSVTNLDFWENENKDRENDLMHHDLSDFGNGNFEDIDKMFSFWRNCDATFGQELPSTANELSWFLSSSNTAYGSDITLESGLQSTFSELSEMNNTFGHHGAYTSSLPKSDQPTATHCKLSSLHYLSYACLLDTDAEYKGESAPIEPVYDVGNGINITSFTQVNGENVLNGCKDADMINMHLKKMGSPSSPEEKKIQPYADQEFLSSAILTQSNSSQDTLNQKPFVGASTSGYMHTFNPHPQLEDDSPTHQIPFPQATSSVKFENATDSSSSYKSSDNFTNHVSQCMERFPDDMGKTPTMTPNEKFEKLHDRHELCATMIAEHMHQKAYFTSKVELQKKHRENEDIIGANRNVEIVSLDPVIDSSVVRDMSSVYPNEVSLEATSFKQLQDVMDQLDNKTNLCIRDSLYRLARGAKQRHSFADSNNCSRESKDERGLQCTEPTKNRCAELMDAENVTNHIDRSIAHLLFTGLLNPATGSFVWY